MKKYLIEKLQTFYLGSIIKSGERPTAVCIQIIWILVILKFSSGPASLVILQATYTCSP